jgi:hypothetical protein
MVVLLQLGRFALITLPMFLRWIVGELDQIGSRVWVTGRTGNVTVVTDKFF